MPESRTGGNRGDALRYITRALLWAIPLLVGGLILNLSTMFLSFPTPLLGIVPLAGLGASTSACLVSSASSLSRFTGAGLLALAIVPVLISVVIIIAISPMLEVAAAVVLFSVVLISGSPALYVISALTRRGMGRSQDGPLQP